VTASDDARQAIARAALAALETAFAGRAPTERMHRPFREAQP